MGNLNSLIGLNCFSSFSFGPCTHFFLDLSKARKDSRQRLEGGKGFKRTNGRVKNSPQTWIGMPREIQ